MDEETKHFQTPHTLEPWIVALMVINFDTDKGQCIETIYPKEALSETCKDNIRLIAMPDKHPTNVSDLFYVFRIRTELAIPLFSANPSEHSFLFGYTYFRSIQSKDKPRGAFQKSLVILSKIPEYTFFRNITSKIANMYFQYGEVTLETLFSSLIMWPTPLFGHKVECPLYGDIYKARIPNDPKLLDLTTSTAISASAKTPPLPSPRLNDESIEYPDITASPPIPSPTTTISLTSLPPALNLPNDFLHSSISSDKQTDFLLDNEYIPDVLPMDKSTSDCITYDDEREELDEPDSLPLSPAFTFKRNSLLTPSKGHSKSPQQFFDDFIAPSPIKSEYGYFQNLPLYATFGQYVGCLWHLWEISITGEPLIIFANDAEQCSMAVLSIVGLISPIIYCGDYRPCFSLCDQDYKDIVKLHDETHGTKLSSIILGVTNPCIIKTLKYWPNCIHLQPFVGDSRRPNKRTPKVVPEKTTLDECHIDNEYNFVSRKTSIMKSNSVTLNRLLVLKKSSYIFNDGYFSSGNAKDDDISSNSGINGDNESDDDEHDYEDEEEDNYGDYGDDNNEYDYNNEYEYDDNNNSKYYKTVPPPPVATTATTTTTSLPSAATLPATIINNKLLRDHFKALTQCFLSPLDYYFQMNQSSISINPYMDVSKLLISFDENEFISRCESTNAILAPFNKMQWRILYSRFFHSPHFRPWFNRRRNEILNEIRDIIQKLRLEMTATDLIHRVEMEHIDKIELYIRIKEVLANEEQFLLDNPSKQQEALVENIKEHLNCIAEDVPAFVKSITKK